jgi:hypothetical protein
MKAGGGVPVVSFPLWMAPVLLALIPVIKLRDAARAWRARCAASR